MRSMWRMAWAGGVLVAAVCLAAPDRPPAVPPAARPALRKYQLAVEDADAERARAIDKARVQLVVDLKAQQKALLQSNDVDGATAVAALARQHAVAGAGPVAPPDFVGVNWRVGDSRYRLMADGKAEKVNAGGVTAAGTWVKTGDRTIALFLGEWIDVWTFEPGGGVVKAVGFARNVAYEAKTTP